MPSEKRRCYLCSVELDSTNDSREHIIPNAIGGRRKVYGIICRKCNSTTGDSWDNELAKQLNPLSLFFGIKRERGNAPSQTFPTTGGKKYTLHYDGSIGLAKPEFEKKPTQDGIELKIKARSVEEARNMLSGVTKKYPNVDCSKLLEKAESKSSYLEDMLHFSLAFGGPNAGRSFVKSCIVLLSTRFHYLPKCNLAEDYLFNENGAPCFGYFYERDLIENRPKGIPFHCIHVEGHTKTHEILAYVEYFGIQRVVMRLSGNYHGEDFSVTYAINPRDGTNLSLSVAIDLTSEEILDAYNYKKIPDGSIEEAFSPLIETRLSYQHEEHQEKVVQDAVQYAFNNCGAEYGETLTEEHMSKVRELLMERLEPYIIHLAMGSHHRDIV